MNVFLWEDHFVHYFKKDFFSYWQCTNGPCEGTNFGIKHNSALVMPCNTMVQASKSLSIQSSLKTSHLDHKYASNAFKTSLWSNSKTKDHVIVPCESMLQQILVRIPEYVTRRINNTTWEVLHKRHIPFLNDDHDFLQTANFDNVFADDESLYEKPS